jgi:plasmid stability protein
MRNVTLSLPDEVYRRARVKAAERNTSVSALVREFLISVAEEEHDFARRKRLQGTVLRSIRRFQAANRLGRETVHERRRARGRAVR